MTAPSQFNLTGTITEPDATASVGTVKIRSSDARFKNNSNILNQLIRAVTLDGSGTIGTQVLPQATNGYDLEIDTINPSTGLVRPTRKQHVAGTANLSITPTHTTMTVTGTWYSYITGVTLAVGSVELTDLDTVGVDSDFPLGDVFVVPLVSGAISKVLFKNTLGYLVVEKHNGRTPNGQASYVIPGTASIDLTTV